MSFLLQADLNGALKWLQPSLDAGFESVSSYLNELPDAGRAGAGQAQVTEQLRQITGALRLIDLPATARLALELNDLIAALPDAGARLEDMRAAGLSAVAALSIEIKQLEAGQQPHIASNLYPALQQLRNATQSPAPTGAELFFPPLFVTVPERPAALELTPPQVATVVQAQRRSFQKGLIAWVRGEGAGVLAMAQALEEVEGLLGRRRGEATWWLAAGLMDCLRAEAVPLDAGVKKLFSRLDRQLERWSEARLQVADELLRDMLYAIGRARPAPTLRVLEIQQCYELDRFFGTPAPAVVLLEDARAAVDETRAAVQRYASGESSLAAREQLRRLPMGAGVLDREPVRELLRTLANAGSALPEHTQDDPALTQEISAALELTTSLLRNQASLNDDLAISASHRLREAIAAARAQVPKPTSQAGSDGDAGAETLSEHTADTVVLREMRLELAQVEVALEAFLRDPAKSVLAPEALQGLKRLLGALRIMGMDTHAQVVAECSVLVESLSQADAAVEAAKRELVTSALSTIGLVLDEQRNGSNGFGFLLNTISMRLRASQLRVEAAVAEAQTSLAQEVQSELARCQEALEVWQQHPDAPELKAQLHDALEEVRADAALVGDAHLEGHAEHSIEILASTGVQPTPELAEAVNTLGGVRLATLSGVPLAVPSAPGQQHASAGEDIEDQEILAVFLEEASEVLSGMKETLAQLRRRPEAQQLLGEIRRGFHTLKGSGRMVGLRAFGEAAWIAEQAMNGWLERAAPASTLLIEFTELSQRSFQSWIEQIAAGANASIDAAALEAMAQRLEQQGQLSADSATDEEQWGITLATQREAADEPTQPPLEQAPAPAERDIQSAAANLNVRAPLLGVYLEEAQGLLALLRRHTTQWRDTERASPNEEFMRAAHTLAGSSLTVAQTAIAELAGLLERWAIACVERTDDAPAPTSLLAHEAVAQLEEMLARLSRGEAPASAPSLLQRLNAALTQLRQDQVARAQAWSADLEDLLAAAEQSAEPAPLEAANPAAALRDIDLVLDAAPALEQALPVDAAAEQLAWDAAPEPPVWDVAPKQPALEAAPQQEVAPMQPVFEAAPEPSTSAALESVLQRTGIDRRWISDDIDAELLPTFLEEADALLPELISCLESIRRQPDERQPRSALARTLHTLKGSARMVGALRLGELIHGMEEELVAAEQDLSNALLNLWVAKTDRIADALDKLHRDGGVGDVLVRTATLSRSRDDLTLVSGTSTALRDLDGTDGSTGSHSTLAVPALQPGDDSDSGAHQTLSRAMVEVTGSAAQLLEQIDTAGDAHAPVSAAAAEPLAARALLRVAAATVDALINQAGEASIVQSRADAELRVLRSALIELTNDAIKLRQQARELEIQAEAQMASKQQHSPGTAHDFDPLEFDRFTRVQELTRIVSETVNDIATVQQLAMKNLDACATALSAQGRMSFDLQENLMRLRVVPFATNAERFQRTVRMTARELGKQVRLEIEGDEVGVDRGVLEQITAPLDHLLRNAVAHGIESEQQRTLRGKALEGVVRLVVRQRGNDIVVTVSDDGGGLDLERVRANALRRGLIAAEDGLTPEQQAALIFLPGFSTATEVTEIAGRGVGLDVVKSAIAALGGRVEIDSRTDVGTSFTIYVPLTLAATEVLLVRAGAQRYAVPVPIVQLVQRFTPEAMTVIRSVGQLSWGGEAYSFHDLATLLGRAGVAQENRFTHVLLLRSGGLRVAVRVDELVATRRVVVKSIGTQLAGLTGITGASLMADGEIVLIIDPVALSQRKLERGASALASAPALASIESAKSASACRSVLVVDDSITIRRVTERFLSREGYDVVTAKDGADALDKLSAALPDIMLVDIEMPRMDGFELTRHVRGDARTSSIPIIMITSRAATKHREHALQLGVNVYLGKPFTEDDLLQHITTLLGERAATAVRSPEAPPLSPPAPVVLAPAEF